jgi:hypothetical protein
MLPFDIAQPTQIKVIYQRKEADMKKGKFIHVGIAVLTATGLATAGLSVSSCNSRSAEEAGKKIDSAVEATKQKASSASQTAEQAVEATKKKMGEGMEAAKDTAKQATAAVVELAGNAAQATGDAAKAAGDAAKQKADETKEKLQ